MEANIAINIKNELKNPRKYAKEHGIRITIEDENLLEDIKQLINIKLTNYAKLAANKECIDS